METSQIFRFGFTFRALALASRFMIYELWGLRIFCPHKEQSGGGYAVLFVKEYFFLKSCPNSLETPRWWEVFSRSIAHILNKPLHKQPRIIFQFTSLHIFYYQWILCFIRPLQLNFSCWLSNEFDPFVSKERKGAKNPLASLYGELGFCLEPPWFTKNVYLGGIHRRGLETLLWSE